MEMELTLRVHLYKAINTIWAAICLLMELLVANI
jgi:hypothetical protein